MLRYAGKNRVEGFEVDLQTHRGGKNTLTGRRFAITTKFRRR